MPVYALLKVHFPSQGLRAWRLALLLDRQFAGRCLERIQLVADLQERHPDLEELRFSLGGDWDQRVRVLEILPGGVDPELFDEELDALDEAVVVDEIPPFARDVTDREAQFVFLGVSQNGIWIDYVEAPGEPTNSAEFVTEGQLEHVLRRVDG